MKLKKRQFVLAGLVLCLGTAVYLNWQFSGSGDIPVAEADAAVSELGAALLVNAPMQEHETEENPSLDNNTSVMVETEVPTDAEPANDYFAEAMLNRQKTRDAAMESLNEILNDSDADQNTVQKAVEESAEIAKQMLAEGNMESLIKAKGYSNCVVFLQSESCNIVVEKAEPFTQNDATLIQDIVLGQYDIPCDKIKIVSYMTDAAE